MILRSGRPFTVNELLLDASIRHQIYLERLKTGEIARAIRLLNELVIPDLVEKLETALSRIRARGIDADVQRTQQYKDLILELDAIVRAGMRELEKDSNASLFDIARHEAGWQHRALTRIAGPFGLEFNLPDAGILRSIVTSRPMRGHLLKDWWADLAVGTRKKVQAELNIGIAEGEDVEAIVRRIRGTREARYTDGILQQRRHAIASVVRTAVSHVTSHATQETLVANSDLLKGQQLVATLDLRTTFICRDRDGNVYAIGKAPPLPFHWGERSRYVPLLKSAKELGLNLRELPPGTRASMNGEVPEKLTYWDWLAQQSEADQIAALGPRRAELFRSGRIQPREFADSFGHLLTLKELEAIEA